MQIDYFKRPQRDGFHYYEVHGGPGKTEDGFQVVLNFLNLEPVITTEHNDIGHPMGTWCTFEVGIPITREEYKQAFERAINDPSVKFF